MMWRHYCPIEKTWISVGKGEPCNWCDTPEPKSEPPKAPPQPQAAKKGP
jgi:hypothetical protein